MNSIYMRENARILDISITLFISIIIFILDIYTLYTKYIYTIISRVFDNF